MIIATFGPTTGWSGKTITYEGGVFALEDSGPLSAGDVMEYDRQGYLLWSTDGTRAWIASMVTPVTPVKRSGTPGWVFAIVGGVVVLAVFAAIVLPIMVGTKGQSAERAASAAAVALVPVFTWPGGGAGNDIRNSEPFTLQGGHQVVTIASTALSGEFSNPMLGWTIQGVDGGFEMLNPASFGSARSDLYLPAGSYYLSSNTIDCTWSLAVSEER